MKITLRALVMGSALVLAGGWFVFDYFGDQLGFGSPVKPGIGPAKSTAAEPIKTSGGTSETQLAMINSLSGISLASLAQTVERPLFNRARAPKPKPEPQVAVESDEPESGPQDFTLLGIVVANDDKTALHVDATAAAAGHYEVVIAYVTDRLAWECLTRTSRFLHATPPRLALRSGARPTVAPSAGVARTP